ncbi:MAG: type IV toxin-antitoxin system AbiEi family antitoxin domain-containing protein [Actinomycetota bacterium]
MSDEKQDLAPLSAKQLHVVSRANLEASGVTDHMTHNRVRAGYWQRVHPGVVAMFPGELTREQREWAAVLYVQSQLRDGEWALVAGPSAARHHGLVTEDPDVVHLLVPHRARVVAATGMKVRRTRRRYAKAGSPGWTEIEETVLDLVEEAMSEKAVLDLLISAIQKRVAPSALLNRADRRKRLHNRGLLLECIARTPDGVESHLELRYHRDVERAHGLPMSTRQGWERVRGHWIRADCRYAAFGLRVELDGELAHPGRATHADVLRDNDALLISREMTLRFRWSHVVEDPCLAAAQTALGLRLGGWTGMPSPCSEGCRVLEHVRTLEESRAQRVSV